MKRYKKYVWNTGYLLNKEKITTLDPQPIAERLEFLRQENGGSIRPDDVLEDAKNAESPLAVLFTNSIENDAYEYRLQIARTVINSVRVEVINKETKALDTEYAFVNVRDVDNSHKYVSLDTVRTDVDIHARVIEEAERRLNQWVNRYDTLSELAPVVKAIKKAMKKRKDK
jgi:hypothetical protein|tara:strand:- start:738 stop:1250 length:513 start_codon:yes stop_codon:yes gene_type:complete